MASFFRSMVAIPHANAAAVVVLKIPGDFLEPVAGRLVKRRRADDLMTLGRFHSNIIGRAATCLTPDRISR